MSNDADEDGNPVPPPPIENYQRYKPRCKCGNWINKIGATCIDCQLKEGQHDAGMLQSQHHREATR